MKFYFPPQLKHLLPAFLVFILLFLIGRRLVVPDTFYEFGHYRGASLEDNANKEPLYAGHESCRECHSEIAENKEYDVHAEVACETCHGPGLAHVQDPENIHMGKPEGREFCGLCHGLLPGGSRDFVFQVDITEHHMEKKNCTDCHNPHMPWELKE